MELWGKLQDFCKSEADLSTLACSLVDDEVIAWPERETTSGGPLERSLAGDIRSSIANGEDPLGDLFCFLRSPSKRRRTGATYTPLSIVEAMMERVSRLGTPTRIVDPGAGSGRFLFSAARRFPGAKFIAVETDPLACQLLRANAAVLGISKQLEIKTVDYRGLELDPVEGNTLFVGNPPYVRHHDISPEWKEWFSQSAAELGFKASKLAGLHIHFFLKTRQLAQAGDFGSFITSAEWLDVNYGSLLRELLMDGLGGEEIHLLSPLAMPFSDALTTGAVTYFRPGAKNRELVMRSVDGVADLAKQGSEQIIALRELTSARRWSAFARPRKSYSPDLIELGDLFSVHRGQVTGANRIWIQGAYPGELPKRFLIPTVTKAKEIIAANSLLTTDISLRRVIDLPPNIDMIEDEERLQVLQFLEWAREQGAHKSYVARHRRAWWSVGLYEPAPVLCTYMARRVPAFVVNRCQARHLNISHGLYPRQPIGRETLQGIISWLQANVSVDNGRTYAGGLTKFEPRELQRVKMPRLTFFESLIQPYGKEQHFQSAPQMG